MVRYLRGAGCSTNQFGTVTNDIAVVMRVTVHKELSRLVKSRSFARIYQCSSGYSPEDFRPASGRVSVSLRFHFQNAAASRHRVPVVGQSKFPIHNTGENSRFHFVRRGVSRFVIGMDQVCMFNTFFNQGFMLLYQIVQRPCIS